MNEVVISTSGITFEEVISIARGGAKIKISDESIQAMAKTRDHIDHLASSENPVYGISTGFGALAQKHILPKDRVQLQKSLIRSHAAGMGEVVETEVVRAMMTLRLKTMCSGHTGVRPETALTYAEMLNSGITPKVLEFGSLGCSGDLSPLAHCALVLMGEGEAKDETGVFRSSSEVLAKHGIKPVELAEKEGLALINGTDGMLGMLILAIADLRKLLDTADVVAAMSVEGQMGTDQVFRSELHEGLRAHPGQIQSAKNMFDALQGSEIVSSHRHDDGVVQDAYSLRCSPQVTGAVRDTLAHAERVAQIELDSVIDNPVVLSDGEVTSNGNFHGAPIGYVLDYLAIAVTDLSSISERRTDRFLDTARNRGLPGFLAFDPGVDSGMMIAQYTQASLVSENKRLSVPASVDSIPSSAMQEDHVSMGWHAARKLLKVVGNLRRVVAIELVVAARAIELRQPLKPSPKSAAMIRALRDRVSGFGPDEYLSEQLESAENLLFELDPAKSK